MARISDCVGKTLAKWEINNLHCRARLHLRAMSPPLLGAGLLDANVKPVVSPYTVNVKLSPDQKESAWLLHHLDVKSDWRM